MPIYDFKCPKCRKKYKDVILPIDHKDPLCTKCDIPLVVDFSRMEYGISKKGGGWTAGAGSNRRKV